MLIAAKGAQERLKALLQGLMSLSPVRRGSALLALALAALLAIVAVACGGDAGSGADAGSDNGVVNRSAQGSMTVETFRSPT